jgi:hypothetical protein
LLALSCSGRNKELDFAQKTVQRPVWNERLRITPSCAALARGYSYLSPTDFSVDEYDESVKNTFILGFLMRLP